MKWDLYFITDSTLTVNGILDDVAQALKAGCGIVQYREKGLSMRTMCEQGEAIKKMCKEYDAAYIVNDRLDVALATGAHGVHLGQSDMTLQEARSRMPQGIVGVSATTVSQGIDAFHGGADYLGVGPIYATTTKDDAASPIGLDPLRELEQKVDIPLVAIGGIDLGKIEEIVTSGADGVAAISATVGENVYEKVRCFLGNVEDAKHGRRR